MSNADYFQALDDAITVIQKTMEEFLSPEYATPQPIGSIQERFACSECMRAIDRLKAFKMGKNKINWTYKTLPEQNT